MTIREVRRASANDVVAGRAAAAGALIVERPFYARDNAISGVFVVDDATGEVRRAVVSYGRSSSSVIEIVSGVSPGDRIVVSDMSAWDQFERLRLRAR